VNLLRPPTARARRRTAIGWTVVFVLALVFVGGESLAADGSASDPSVASAMLVVLAALAAMVALGLPLFVILGVLAVLLYALLSQNWTNLLDFDVPSETASMMMNKEVLLAIPFFVASGAIMSKGSIAERLVNLARALLGWIPGGLAVATVVSCTIFAAISGSSPVTVIAIGSMMYPRLVRAGYDKRFSLGLLSSAGSLGILIPPSIPMLVYAIVASSAEPIDSGELFMAGVVPGLMLGGLMAVYSIFRAGKSSREAFDLRVVRQRIKEGMWALSVPVLILGGIYLGVFVPTEAAAISVVYALIVELLIHRDLKVKQLPGILSEAAVTMGSILIIMALAMAINAFVVDEGIPERIVEWIRDQDLSPIAFFLVVNGFLLLVGAFMDSISAILIIAPLIAPIGVALGIDPVHLGVIFIVNLEIGYLTPPIGINLFVASSVFRQPMGAVARGVLPFIALMVVGLGIVTYVPTVSMGLVNVVKRDKPMHEPFPTVPEKESDEDDLDEDDLDEDEDEGEHETTGDGDGGKVLTIEQMMQLAQTDGSDEDDDDDADDADDADQDEDGGSVAPAPGQEGRVLTIEEMMKKAEREGG
jgi:C4-dicarboxylate transporter DctM subunit